MPGVSQGFEGSCLFFLLDVINGECLLYKKLIFSETTHRISLYHFYIFSGNYSSQFV